MYHDLSMASVGTGNITVTQSLGLSFLLVAALTARASSQTILIDDFNDGVADGWTTIDTTLGHPWGPGVFDASSGAYHLESTGLAPGTGGTLVVQRDQSFDPIFSNGFLRAKFKVETLGGGGGLDLRSNECFGPCDSGTGYQFIGTTAHGGAFLFIKNVDGQITEFKRLSSHLSFGVNEWWNIEAGAVADKISMKVWPVGDPEPVSPQFIYSDRTFLSGGSFAIETKIDVSFGSEARISATVDDIHFTFPRHEDPFTSASYDIYLWESPMPVPQVAGPFFVDGSPEKPDMRGDVTPVDNWPDLRITGRVTDLDGEPIPGLKLDFWQVDDQGSYDNSGGYDLRGHLFTDDEGNYELWTVMPANYESIRTRHLHAKLGGENLGFDSWAYTTQVYFPEPYDNDIDADGTPDKVIEGGVLTNLDAIALDDDFITLADLDAVGAEFADLASNILTLNNDPLVDGYFDTTLNIMMPDVFQVPGSCDFNGDQICDGIDIDQLMTDAVTGGMDTDLNGDGTVDNADRDQWLALAGPENGFAGPLLVGDSDLNGTVDALDLNALALSWQDPQDHNWTSGNFSVAGGSGVNAGDLNGLALNWRASSAAAAASQAVPEPNAFALMLLSVAMGSRLRRMGS